MHHSAEPDFLSQLDTSFAQLNPQEVEQFYAAYKQWLLQQHIASLQQRILHIQQQLAENAQLIQQTQPSPIALATLARLQSNGVNDIDLLDSMFARGEAWLDATMQRLDYCEQINDFISDDYTQWCKRALEGAFDWFDSLRDDASTSPSTIEESPPVSAATAANAEAEATEALLLQKLTSESDEQEDVSWQEETLKQTAIKSPALGEPEASNPAEIPAAQSPHEEYIPLQEENQSNDNPADASLEQATTEEYIAPEEPLPLEDTSTSEGESPAFVEFASTEEPSTTVDTTSNVSEQPTLVETPIPEEIATAGQTSSPEPEHPKNIEVEEPGQSEEFSSDVLEHQPAVEPEIPPNKQPPPLTSPPPKRGFIRRLIGILLGE